MLEPGEAPPHDGEEERRRGGERVMMAAGTTTTTTTTTATPTTGFCLRGFTGGNNMVLGRSGPTAQSELRYLHLLWEPGRTDPGSGVASNKLGKVGRARRLGRASRNPSPIGRDLYGQ